MEYRNHHNLGGYGANYYEEERQVIRDPCDSYASEYRVQEYANPGYPRHQNGGYIDKVTEFASYESNPGHHHRRGVAGIVEKVGDIVYEKTHDPYKRSY